MSQHNFTIANDTGINVRNDIEDAFQALASLNAGTAAPATTYPYLVYADSSTGIIRIRNVADTAWIILPFKAVADNTIGYGSSTSVKIDSTVGLEWADGTIQNTAYPGTNAYKNWSTVWAVSGPTVFTQVGPSGDYFDCAITPKSASNKVLVMMDFKMSHKPDAVTYATDAPWVQIWRSSTGVHQGTGTVPVATAYLCSAAPSATLSAEYSMFSYTAMFIDSPATTSAVTYTAYVKCPSVNIFIKTNEPYTNTQGVSAESSFVLQEMPASAG